MAHQPNVWIKIDYVKTLMTMTKCNSYSYNIIQLIQNSNWKNYLDQSCGHIATVSSCKSFPLWWNQRLISDNDDIIKTIKNVDVSILFLGSVHRGKLNDIHTYQLFSIRYETGSTALHRFLMECEVKKIRFGVRAAAYFFFFVF